MLISLLQHMFGWRVPVESPTYQVGGQKIQKDVIKEIRQLFLLSGNITIERKKKKYITGEVLQQILRDKRFFGKIYNKLNKYSDIIGATRIPYKYQFQVDGGIHQPISTNSNLLGSIYSNITISKNVPGTIHNTISIQNDINGAIFKYYNSNKIFDGAIYKEIYVNADMYGAIFIKGIDDPNIIKKAILNFDDDELFISLLTKKYKI